MFATGVTMDLAEGIIDDTCLVGIIIRICASSGQTKRILQRQIMFVTTGEPYDWPSGSLMVRPYLI